MLLLLLFLLVLINCWKWIEIRKVCFALRLQYSNENWWKNKGHDTWLRGYTFSYRRVIKSSRRAFCRWQYSISNELSIARACECLQSAWAKCQAKMQAKKTNCTWEIFLNFNAKLSIHFGEVVLLDELIIFTENQLKYCHVICVLRHPTTFNYDLFSRDSAQNTIGQLSLNLINYWCIVHVGLLKASGRR